MKRAASALGTLLAISLAVAMLAPSLLGYERYVITGGSMEPTIERGSLVFDEVVPTAQLRTGDVVTYRPPAGEGPGGLVTHRIVWTGRDKDGATGFRTKGDANAATDPWRFGLGDRQARVAFHVPYAGYVLAFVARPRVRMVLIGLPALLVGLFVLGGLWREAGDEARAHAGLAA